MKEGMLSSKKLVHLVDKVCHVKEYIGIGDEEFRGLQTRIWDKGPNE